MSQKTILRYFANQIQNWQVPSSLSGNKVTIEMWGSQGQGASWTGGKGGYVKFDLAVTPGQILYFNVGRQSPWRGVGGYPDGGAGGKKSNTYGGGGSTACMVGGVANSNQVAVAAGGGAAVVAGGGAYAQGGEGGAANGANGYSLAAFGYGGSQTTGGAGGTHSGGHPGSAGSRYQGGDGDSGSSGGYSGYGSGGGGGYYGGGGGGSDGSGLGGSGGGGSNYLSSDASVSNTTSTRGATNPDGSTDGYVRITYATTPNAPAISTTTGYNDFDEAIAEPISWVPDINTVQGSADVRWRRPSSIETWTTITGAVTDDSRAYNFGAGLFSAYTNQQIEVQVRTVDQYGTPGTWSISLYLTPRVAPAAPTVPDFGAQINTNSPSYTIEGAGGAQFDQYQARALDDSAGAPGTTVLADTGIQNEQTPKTSQAVSLPSYAYDNGVSYHLQARVASPLGVWSPWADSGALVASINAPLTPTIMLTPFPATGSVKIVIANPAGGEPVAYNQIYRTDLTTGQEELIATNVVVNGQKTDWNVGYTRTYRYRVVAIGMNGAVTSSA